MRRSFRDIGGWGRLFEDKIGLALYAVNVSAVVWWFVGDYGQSAAGVVAVIGGLVAVVHTQRRYRKQELELPPEVECSRNEHGSTNRLRVVRLIVSAQKHPLDPLIGPGTISAVILSVVAAFISGAVAVPPDTDITFNSLHQHADLVVLTVSAVVAATAAVLVTITVGVRGIRRAAASGTLPRHFDWPDVDDDERALILQQLHQQRRSRILWASFKAATAGIASGCAIAAAIVLFFVEPHPSNLNNLATTSILFAGAMTFVGSGGVALTTVISPRVRACADAVAAEPQLAHRPLQEDRYADTSTEHRSDS